MKMNINTPHIDAKYLAKRMVPGAIAGLAVILLFLSSIDQPHPDWGRWWILRPLVMVPLAGAFSGLIFCSMDFIPSQNQWLKAAALVFSVVAFILVLWMGIVLGLDGTLWN